MFYSLFVVSRNIIVIVLLIMHYWITVHSQTVCHIATIAFILTLAGEEVFTTNILYHSAYIMYCCYHMKSAMSKKRSEYLFRRYIAYAGFTLILLFFVTIAYDWRTGMDKYTILPNGHCSFIEPFTYKTLYFFIFNLFINKILQMTMFSAYLYYLYKKIIKCSCCTGAWMYDAVVNFSGLPQLWVLPLVFRFSLTSLFLNLQTLSSAVLFLISFNRQ